MIGQRFTAPAFLTPGGFLLQPLAATFVVADAKIPAIFRSCKVFRCSAPRCCHAAAPFRCARRFYRDFDAVAERAAFSPPVRHARFAPRRFAAASLPLPPPPDSVLTFRRHLRALHYTRRHADVCAPFHSPRFDVFCRCASLLLPPFLPPRFDVASLIFACVLMPSALLSSMLMMSPLYRVTNEGAVIFTLPIHCLLKRRACAAIPPDHARRR